MHVCSPQPFLLKRQRYSRSRSRPQTAYFDSIKIFAVFIKSTFRASFIIELSPCHFPSRGSLNASRFRAPHPTLIRSPLLRLPSSRPSFPTRSISHYLMILNLTRPLACCTKALFQICSGFFAFGVRTNKEPKEPTKPPPPPPPQHLHLSPTYLPLKPGRSVHHR